MKEPLIDLHKLLEEDYNQSITKGKSNLENEGCIVNGIPKCAVIIQLDEVGSPFPKTAIRCDYIVFVSNNEGNISAFVIELKSGKSGNISVSHAKDQLQSGANFLEGFQGAKKLSIKLNLIPILFGKLSKSQKDQLQTKRISYKGQNITIKKSNCGNSLTINS